MTAEPQGRDVKAARAVLMERMAQKLDRYLPESGELRAWTISEIEDALIEDMNELARDIVHARLGVDPDRVVEKPRCPDCGRALMGVDRERSTHTHTRLGPIRYARTVGYCRSCGAAFSPSGQRVELRQGLL
jgi:uncharacterized protein with PIN domain